MKNLDRFDDEVRGGNIDAAELEKQKSREIVYPYILRCGALGCFCRFVVGLVSFRPYRGRNDAYKSHRTAVLQA